MVLSPRKYRQHWVGLALKKKEEENKEEEKKKSERMNVWGRWQGIGEELYCTEGDRKIVYACIKFSNNIKREGLWDILWYLEF